MGTLGFMINWLNNLKVASKVYLAAGIMLSAIVAITVTVEVMLSRLEAEIVEIAEEDVPLVQALNAATIHGLEQIILTEKALQERRSAAERRDLCYH